MHPTRCQIFAGKPYSTFFNIWDLLIHIVSYHISQLTPSLIESYSWQIITFSFCSLWIDSLWFPFPQHPSDWIYNLPRGGISILWCWILHYNAFQLNGYWNWCHANKKWVETKVSNVNVNWNCSSKFNTREKNWISFSNSPNPEMTTIACQRRVPNPTAAPFETSIRNTSLDWKSPAGSKRGGYLSFLFWNWKKNKKNQTWSDIWHCYLRPDSDHFLT